MLISNKCEFGKPHIMKVKLCVKPRCKLLCILNFMVTPCINNIQHFNPLKPNDLKKRRTTQLTSRCCILYIYSTNIRTEYFKHAA